MKKLYISILLCAIIVLSGLGCVSKNDTEYLRIHIRANSNSEIDQQVKYKVKESVVNFLTPLITDVDSFCQAENIIKDNLESIENVANGVLSENGFSYLSKAKINNELFPTRTYSDLVLESGYYDALILELGSGQGDNWWCVVYPPLCFTGENVVYQSKILEIIRNFKEKL